MSTIDKAKHAIEALVKSNDILVDMVTRLSTAPTAKAQAIIDEVKTFASDALAALDAEKLADDANSADVSFLLDRAMQSGKITFGGYRETGISSNSIVAIAYRMIPIVKQELPSDESDLDACRNMWKKLPEHRKTVDARAAMLSAESVIAEKYHK